MREWDLMIQNWDRTTSIAVSGTLVIKDGNGTSPLNGGVHGKLIEQMGDVPSKPCLIAAG